MATGWAREGAVQEQIDDTVKDGVLRAKSRMPQGPSATHCQDAASRFPKRAARRWRACTCASRVSKRPTPRREFSGYNRRGSKDSQLR